MCFVYFFHETLISLMIFFGVGGIGVTSATPLLGTVVGKIKYLSPSIQEQLPPEMVGCAA